MSTENVFIKQICQYIADNSSLTFGAGTKTLKIGEIQMGESGVYALASPSETPEKYTVIEYHNIDFWAVNKKSSTAMQNLRELYVLLHQAHHYDTTSFRVFFSHAIGQIDDLDRDGENRKVLRLGIRFVIMNLIS